MTPHELLKDYYERVILSDDFDLPFDQLSIDQLKSLECALSFRVYCLHHYSYKIFEAMVLSPLNKYIFPKIMKPSKKSTHQVLVPSVYWFERRVDITYYYEETDKALVVDHGKKHGYFSVSMSEITDKPRKKNTK